MSFLYDFFFVTRYVFLILIWNLVKILSPFWNLLPKNRNVGVKCHAVSRVLNILEWNAIQFFVISIFWNEMLCRFLCFQYFRVKYHALSLVFFILEGNAMRFLVFSVLECDHRRVLARPSDYICVTIRLIGNTNICLGIACSFFVLLFDKKYYFFNFFCGWYFYVVLTLSFL